MESKFPASVTAPRGEALPFRATARRANLSAETERRASDEPAIPKAPRVPTFVTLNRFHRIGDGK